MSRARQEGAWRLVAASAFADVADAWNALNDASFRSPVLHSEFVAPLLAHFGQGRERIALLDGQGSLQCATIVAQANVFVWNTFQPSQAPIGLWLQKEGASGLPSQPVFESLAARSGVLVAMIGVNQLDPDHVARPGPDRAQTLSTDDYIRTARIRISGSFDDYWAARGKNLRANMKKQRAKLESEGVAPRLECLTQATDVAAAIVDYGRLESAGWKASGGTAVDADNAQGRFYRAVLENFCARGAGRIYRYFYGDRLVAMDLCIAHAGTMVILKTAFDETIKGTSPAFLMRYEYLPAIFANREFSRVEFYGRVMDWHTRWTDEVRTVYHATAYRWQFAQQLDQMRRRHAARGQAREAALAVSSTTVSSTTSEADAS